MPNLDLARSIASLAREHMLTLAADHDAHPWADPDAHARYAERYTATSFAPFGNRVTALTRKGETDAAADALDYAAAVLDNADGRIDTHPDGLSVTYTLAP